MFEDLLQRFSTYFRMDHIICEETMAPIIKFKSLTSDEVFEFKIPRTDIQDYRKDEKMPKSIQDMILGLTSYIRDKKIDKIIKDV
jgi:hypothetical protein